MMQVGIAKLKEIADKAKYKIEYDSSLTYAQTGKGLVSGQLYIRIPYKEDHPDYYSILGHEVGHAVSGHNTPPKNKKEEAINEHTVEAFNRSF